MLNKKPKVGIALGGGAARGLAHIGVLEAFTNMNIKFDVIVGTSIGALIGGLYALLEDIDELTKKAYSLIESEEFKIAKLSFLKAKQNSNDLNLLYNFSTLIQKGMFYTSSVTRRSFIPEEDIKEVIDSLFPDIKIEETKIKFAAVATDITTGKPITLSKGSLRKAIQASTAIPGIFPPVVIDNRELVDGGLVSMVPVLQTFSLGADIVVAVDVSASLEETIEFKRGVNIIFRAHEITRHALTNFQLQHADLVIRPDVGDIHWADFYQIERCIKKGKEKVYDSIDEIRRLFRRKWYWHFFNKWIKKELIFREPIDSVTFSSQIQKL